VVCQGEGRTESKHVYSKRVNQREKIADSIWRGGSADGRDGRVKKHRGGKPTNSDGDNKALRVPIQKGNI
jgi:hypothetical protein